VIVSGAFLFSVTAAAEPSAFFMMKVILIAAPARKPLYATVFIIVI
jgi:hypothetical protein|tara:strand:- start:367 stop:504 length:138 start_codon:yes stop_codon:yes gene_type:complete